MVVQEATDMTVRERFRETFNAVSAGEKNFKQDVSDECLVDGANTIGLVPKSVGSFAEVDIDEDLTEPVVRVREDTLNRMDVYRCDIDDDKEYSQYISEDLLEGACDVLEAEIHDLVSRIPILTTRSHWSHPIAIETDNHWIIIAPRVAN